MPNAPKKPCAYGGCPNLVDHGYCEQHKTSARAVVDQHREWQYLYNATRWKIRRRIQLAEHPWCEECLRANIYVAATDVDHVEPHRGDVVKFFTGELRSLCHPCHSRKTIEEVRGRGG